MVKITNEGSLEFTLNEQQKAWWTEIKNREVQMYGLPDRCIGDFASPMNMEETSLYLAIKAPAAVPAIEIALAGFTELEPKSKLRIPKFSMAMVDKYMVVKPTEGRIVKGANGKFNFIPNPVK